VPFTCITLMYFDYFQVHRILLIAIQVQHLYFCSDSLVTFSVNKKGDGGGGRGEWNDLNDDETA